MESQGILKIDLSNLNLDLNYINVVLFLVNNYGKYNKSISAEVKCGKVIVFLGGEIKDVLKMYEFMMNVNNSEYIKSEIKEVKVLTNLTINLNEFKREEAD